MHFNKNNLMKITFKEELYNLFSFLFNAFLLETKELVLFKIILETFISIIRNILKYFQRFVTKLCFL